MLVPRDSPIMQILTKIGHQRSKQSREGTRMTFSTTVSSKDPMLGDFIHHLHQWIFRKTNEE
jgi:hypothetical protein